MKRARLMMGLALVTMLTGLGTILPKQEANGSALKPYCTTASNQGGYWWTWTANSQDGACTTALFKVLKMRQGVDKAYKGYYKPQGLNKGRLLCKQGQKNVLGSGKTVFENGINMAHQLGWNGCVMKVSN